MTPPATYSFRRYLEAKETVDDRAIHRPTLSRFTAELDSGVAVLEVGSGVGSTLRRLLDWGCLPARVDYTVLDRDDSNVATARERLLAWAPTVGYDVTSALAEDAFPPVDRRSGLDPLTLVRGEECVTVHFVAADAFEFADRLAGAQTWDCLVGQAFADLVDLPEALASLARLLDSGGLWYFPITFDGVTDFTPVDDGAFETDVLDAYHATMDEPDRPGGSRSGRALFDAARETGSEILATGGSDWVVHPPYPDDEAYFLHYIVQTVERAVGDAVHGGEEGVGDRPTGVVDDGRLSAWAAARHAAIDSGDLTYLAHNLDVLGRF
ncbi:MAG: class I SAM-dependent methyltransferase [Halobacteriota archaeon]